MALQLHLLSVICCLLTLTARTLGQEHETRVRVFVKEGNDVFLPCSLGTQDITKVLFDWRKVPERDQGLLDVFMYHAGEHYNNGRQGQSDQFKGRASHFPDELKHGNASIVIRDSRKTDSGNYTCGFPYLLTPQTYVELVVVAAPKPFVRTLDGGDTWSLLQCEVRGASPRPKVRWQDSDGNQLPAEEPQVSETGSSYDITRNITVNKTGHYYCVVEQEDIKHQISSETFVYIRVAAPKLFVTALGTGETSLLQCEVQGASPRPKVRWQDSDGNQLPAEEPHVSETGSSYDITVTKTGRYRCVVGEDTKHQISSEISVRAREKDSSSKVSIGWLAFTFVLGGAIALAGRALFVFAQERYNKSIKKLHMNSQQGDDEENCLEEEKKTNGLENQENCVTYKKGEIIM